jgi:uncharacterized LabA/DUF88 family protein
MSCLYIDADNISYKMMEKIVNHIDFNNLLIKKIYGDWSKSELKNWISVCLDYGLEPIQCFRIGKKQSTDIKLITDVVNDINNIFIIRKIYLVTSDSDFSYLCQNIRSKGISLTIMSLQYSILRNYSNNFINLNIENDLLDTFLEIMGDNYVMLLSSFKRDLKNHYNITMNHQEIKEAIEDVSDYFITYTTKNKTYVIYVNDFVAWSKKDFMEKEEYIKKNYKTIFLILSFEELIYQLY